MNINQSKNNAALIGLPFFLFFFLGIATQNLRDCKNNHLSAEQTTEQKDFDSEIGGESRRNFSITLNS